MTDPPDRPPWWWPLAYAARAAVGWMHGAAIWLRLLLLRRNDKVHLTEKGRRALKEAEEAARKSKK